MTRWFCVICGYVHEGDAPPDVCPICMAGPDAFEAMGRPAAAGAAPQARVDAQALTLVIVGNGVAGHHAAEAARRENAAARIVLVSAEPHDYYFRLNLTPFLAGKTARQKLFGADDAFYAAHGIERRLGQPVVALDVAARTLTFADGAELAFDRLVLATGAASFVPPIPGIARAGVHVLRGLDDAEALLRVAPGAAHAVVLGGGLLGLEAAHGLKALGVPAVRILEAAPWLMARQLDVEGAAVLQGRLAALGYEVEVGAVVAAVHGDADGGPVREVRLGDGRAFAADLMVVAAGIASRCELARAAGLAVGRGVQVDDRLETSVVGIYAAGDVAEFDGRVAGLWPTAMAMGMVAGANAVGGDARFKDPVAATFLKVVGIDVYSVGPAAAPPAGADVVRALSPDGAAYAQVVAVDGVVVGGCLVGDVTRAAALHAAVSERRALPREAVGDPAARIAALLA